MPIQAGVSAVLVLALGLESAGLIRMEDVAVGVVVGLVFSQILLTPDPVREIDAAADDLLVRLAKAFQQSADALKADDVVKAEAALRSFSSSHDSLIALAAGIDGARNAARWSLRGRLTARTVAETAARYDRRAIRLYASALLFGEALANALRKGAAPAPDGLSGIISETANRCFRLAGAQPASKAVQPLNDAGTAVPASWYDTVIHLQAVGDVLRNFEEINRPPPAS
ncbi:hypothetical protein [Microvirga flavescens]|uniref:hypothetical protein n=1 Tax=Microvirga flavescens TaxID=2249811 RepID=UPI0018E09A3D|nr:hypothetical protein [Microvirga flavescens]